MKQLPCGVKTSVQYVYKILLAHRILRIHRKTHTLRLYWISSRKDAKERKGKENGERLKLNVERRCLVLRFWSSEVNVERWTLKVERWKMNDERWGLNVESWELRVERGRIVLKFWGTRNVQSLEFREEASFWGSEVLMNVERWKVNVESWTMKD